MDFKIVSLYFHLVSLLCFKAVFNLLFSPVISKYHFTDFTADTTVYSKPKSGSWMILATIDFSKAFDVVWNPAFFHKFILAGLLLALLVGLNLFFLIGLLPWFFKTKKMAPFESVEKFYKDPFLALYFSLFSSVIFLLLWLLPSAALFMLTT